MGTGGGDDNFYFNATNSNSLYSSNSVQINAIQTLIIIKV